ncbi:hypothetical protein, partial [Salmonella enterica]|uniref:hypothetical protein n=1 Tax=Salmonella enterica TaxID=28901 RepID=UPI003D2C6564
AQLKTLGGVSFRSVELSSLLDDRASVERIIEHISVLSERTAPEDTALLFFAGHGLNGTALQQPSIGYGLAVSTTRASEMARTALLWS